MNFSLVYYRNRLFRAKSHGDLYKNRVTFSLVREEYLFIHYYVNNRYIGYVVITNNASSLYEFLFLSFRELNLKNIKRFYGNNPRSN